MNEFENFKKQFEHLLRENESHHNVFISSMLRETLPPNSFGSQNELLWFLTHNNHLHITDGSKASLLECAKSLFQDKHKITTLSGPLSSVKTIIKKLDLFVLKHRVVNVYEWQTVNLHLSATGLLRNANLANIELLRAWITIFINETGIEPPSQDALLRRLIENKRLYLWEDNQTIVSMAGYGSPTYNGIRVGPVFTPKQFRGRGYATTCVASLWREHLKNQYKTCFIFADQNNPSSNSIYRKLGGTHVTSSVHVSLVKHNDI